MLAEEPFEVEVPLAQGEKGARDEEGQGPERRRDWAVVERRLGTVSLVSV